MNWRSMCHNTWVFGELLLLHGHFSLHVHIRHNCGIVLIELSSIIHELTSPRVCGEVGVYFLFMQAISAAIDECIPSKLTSNRNKRPAWLNAPVWKLLRKRDHLAKVAKKTGLTIDRDRYRKAQNKAPAAIEAGYRDHLNTILGNVVSDPRAFYRFINSKRTDTTSIPPIKSNNKVLLTDINKAQCLNNYFGSVFTVEKDGSIPINTSLYPDMPDIQVTTPGVLKLLSQLDVRKSMGPDGISPRILKETSHEVAPILIFIFN